MHSGKNDDVVRFECLNTNRNCTILCKNVFCMMCDRADTCCLIFHKHILFMLCVIMGCFVCMQWIFVSICCKQFGKYERMLRNQRQKIKTMDLPCNFSSNVITSFLPPTAKKKTDLILLMFGFLFFLFFLQKKISLYFSSNIFFSSLNFYKMF